MKSCFFNYITELFKKYLIKNDKLDDVNTQNTIQDSTTTESDQVSINEQVLQMDNSKEKHSYSKLAVCIDNGHGEETPGKRSPYASDKKNLPALYFREYLFTREIAAKLKTELEAIGITVFMCAPEITDIALSARANRANKFKLDNPDKKCVFISIHANASGADNKWHSASGWECWTTVGKNNSDEFAACLYDAADEVLTPLGKKIRKHGKSRADWNAEKNFTVIYKANMPAVLTENLFYDNVDDCKFLLSEEGVDAVVNLHVKGILKYAQETWNM